MSSFKKIKKFWFIALAAVLILVFYLTPLSTLLRKASRPLDGAGSKFFLFGQRTKNLFASLKELPELSQNLRAKDKTIVELLARLSALGELKRQNDELKKIINLKEEKKYSLAAGRILYYRSLLGRNLVSINVGGVDGAALGAPVISADNGFLGKITQVFPESSLFLPAVDSESLVAVSFLEHPEIQAVAAGRFGLGLSVDFIPQEADIKIGDTVVTSILESNTPPGLILGRVADVGYKQEELFKKATVQPIASLDKVDFILVLIP